MDFLPVILVVLAAAVAIFLFAKRNKGTAHAGDLRRDRPEADAISGAAPGARSQDGGRAE